MNVGDLGKLVVAKGFKKLPKVQKIAQSGHTVARVSNERLDTFGFRQFFDSTVIKNAHNEV